MSSIKITTSKGETEVTLHTFPALTGFELNRRYRTDYRMERESSSKRITYALAVLEFAEVGGERLGSERAINSTLESWKNVEAVFHAVLKHNEVDLELAEEKASWFEFAGRELATSFIVEAGALLAPLAQLLEQQKAE